MNTPSCHTIFAEGFFRRNAELFAPYLAEVGLDAKVVTSPEFEIPLAQYVALWEILGREVSQFIGLQVGICTQTSELGIYGHSLRCAPSMQLLLRCMERFFAVLMQGARMTVEDDGKSIVMVYKVIDPAIVQRRQDAEFTLAASLSVMREVTQRPDLTPLRVEFEHQALADTADYRELLGCPVRFGACANRIIYSHDLLDMPVCTADSRMFQALEPFLVQQQKTRSVATDLLSQLGVHIASSLGSGSVSLEQVASSMKISVRTLQRRLSEHGLDFSHLVEDIRRSLAEDYVARSSYSLTEIALLLGYSEASSFSRAFRRWTQQTPQQFRQRARA